MSGIEEFLRARLADDEQMAQAAERHTQTRWEAVGAQGDDEHALSHWAVQGVAVPKWAEPSARDLMLHIARHDPARVLADVAAKRRMVDNLSEAAARCPEDDWPEDGSMDLAPLADQARWSLRCLALAYSDHPDFDESWRP